MAKNQVRIGVGVKDDATKPIKGIRDAFHKLQTQGAKGFAIGAGAAITAKGFSLLDSAASAAIATIGDSVRAASDLNETVSKGRVIFGEGADEIEKWADTAADAFGQSKRQAIDTAAGFAGLFKTVGIELDQATDMSKKLTVLGSDLASFFNTDVDQALQALKSGLSGESEPLRKFNVFLSETAVSAKLAQMGIKKVGGAFTESQKATARYALILEQTADAQGDFARTSDGLANIQKTLNAELENIKAEIGAELLPVMVDLATFAKDELVPAFREIIDVAKEAAPALEFLGMVAQNVLDPAGSARRAKEFIEGLDDVDEAAKDHATSMLRSAFDIEHGLGAEEGALDDVGDATDDLTGETKDLRTAQQKLEDALQDTTDTLEDLSDAMFGATIKAGDLAQAQKDLNEKIKEGPASKSAQDIAIYRGEIAELEQSIFDLQAQMAREAGPKAFYDWLLKQRAALGDTNDALATYIDRLIAASAIRLPGIPHGAEPTGGTSTGTTSGTSGTSGSTTKIPHGALQEFAEGGTVAGPVGSPQLVVAHGGETVTPAGGGATNIYNLTFTGRIGEKKEDIVAALMQAARFKR